MSKLVSEATKSYILRPPVVPVEKKWLFKQVLVSLEQGVPPQLNLATSSLGRGTAKMLNYLAIAQQRAQDLSVEYGLKEKLTGVCMLAANAVCSVKNFIVQKQYRHIDRLIDRGLLAVEDRLRTIRERQFSVETDEADRSPQSCTMVTIRHNQFQQEVQKLKLMPGNGF
ncbi:uncharacterized protein LOC126576655 [Anopheles aquasalis]|uniref:uncharacterized protein LOC126576655 n=1 Tax=Anopheles aquasalis TaxID=42839 RepID=UPI00215AD0F6|nr:uncharacterized protein LOC126576655 [Anopheles aquasalis]